MLFSTVDKVTKWLTVRMELGTARLSARKKCDGPPVLAGPAPAAALETGLQKQEL